MAGVATHPSPGANAKHAARQRRRRSDLWIGCTAMFAAMLTLPIAPTGWQGPEVAAVLAIAATSMLAGQRWALAVVVIAELLLLPTAWPSAFLAEDSYTRVAAFGSLVAVVPGLLAMRRAAAALVLVSGRRRTSSTCRRFHTGLVAIGMIAALLPVI